MRAAPFWGDLEAIAHTLPYDAACLGTGQPPTDRLGTIRQPVLVLTGDDRPVEAPRWVRALDDAADAIASAMPVAERDTFARQSPLPDPAVVADDWCASSGTDRRLRSRWQPLKPLRVRARLVAGQRSGGSGAPRRDRAPRAFGRAGTTGIRVAQRAVGRTECAPRNPRCDRAVLVARNAG